MMSKIKVIMTGPLPPEVGGMATVLQDLKDSSLSQKVTLEFFNTAKTTAEGRSLFTGVASKLSLWLKWLKVLRGKDKTIVHIHTCSGLTFFLDSVLLCLARLSFRPVILHIHGATFDKFVGGLSIIPLLWVKFVMARCHTIIVLSESWQDFFQEEMGGLSLSIVENGVPIQDVIKDRGLTNKTKQILFFGNLARRKGVWDLLEAMKNIDGAVLNFVGGEEDEGIFIELKKRIVEEELENKIKVHGAKRGEEKTKFLQKADFFVLPSYAEGMPIALLEAMSNSLPVIVSPVGGIPEVITDQQEGLIVEAGDVKALTAAISLLVKDEVLRGKMGSKARVRCEEGFGIERVVNKLLNIYSSVN